jgi:hypothetical protein
LASKHPTERLLPRGSSFSKKSKDKSIRVTRNLMNLFAQNASTINFETIKKDFQ